MSGHSKWSTIKRKKGLADAKKGQAFTKLGKIITLAAREGGGDPNMNFTLRLAMDKAKQVNMPADNIDRAIKRGTGESADGYTLEKAVYGGYGPGGVAIVVDVTTDNKNRTVSELRRIFEESGGSLAEANSVLWQFTEKGLIIVKAGKMVESGKFGEAAQFTPAKLEDVMIEIMNIEGVEDIKDVPGGHGEPDACEVYCAVKDLKIIREAIEKLGYVIDDVSLARIPTNPQAISDEEAEKISSLMEKLAESEDVDEVWVNLEK